MKRRSLLSAVAAIVVLTSMVTAYAAIVGAKKEGVVEYVGAQKEIFKTGKAAGHIDDITLGDGMVLRLPKP